MVVSRERNGATFAGGWKKCANFRRGGKMKIAIIINATITALLIGIATGCSTTSPFSEKGYEQATSLKVEAMATMDKAREPYSSQRQVVERLTFNIEKAYEYAKGRPNNGEVAQQWKIIKDPARNSLGGFLKRWQDSVILNESYILEAKGIVSDGFDTVIELESGKRKVGEGRSP